SSEINFRRRLFGLAFSFRLRLALFEFKTNVFLSVNTRNALKGLTLREMKRSSKSVLPVSSSFFICSRSTDRCRITLPDQKSHVLFKPNGIFTDVAHSEFENASPAFGTCSQRFLPSKLHGLRCAVVLAIGSNSVLRSSL